jgi:hypothetical protein
MRRIAILCLMAVALTAGCAGAKAGDGTASGVRGVVVAGPQCPVEQADSPCPDQPTAASVKVTNADGTQLVKLVDTDATGHFEIELEPGTYQLQPLPKGQDGIQFGKPQTVIVPPGAFVDVTLVLDTGIR